MSAIKRTIAATELLLISPAALFMTALFVRNLTPKEHDVARTAQAFVMLYAARPRIGLWLLLIALPLSVLVIGCGTLLQRWSAEAELRAAARQTLATVRANFAMVLIAATTMLSGGILAAVALHVMTD